MPPESLSEVIVNPFEGLGQDLNQIVAPIEIKPEVSLEVPSLLPSVPPNTLKYEQGQPKVDSTNLLDFFLKDKPKSDATGPMYNYGTKEENRYSNPFMQYTPDAQGHYSTEDAYGKNQGAGDQLYNSLIKTGATVGATFISGFSALPRELDALRKGSSELYKESNFTETQDWLHSLEDKYPNYMTQVEADRSWIANAFTPTGAANFWGDTVLKNMGFTIGAMANAVVIDTGISLLSGGTATPAALILAGKQMSNIAKGLRSSYKALTKSAVLGKADDVIGMASSKGLMKSLDATNKVFGLKNSAQLAATTYFSAQGEAMIEGYQTYIDTKTKLLEDAYSNGKPFTQDFLKGVDETASAAGKNTMLINSVLLSASNLVQFPKLLGWANGSDILKKASGDFINISSKEGLKATSTWTRKQAYKNLLKDTFFKGFVSEGLEEGSQFFVGHSLHDYYLDKFDQKTKKGMLEYMVGALPKTLQDGDFWKEAIIGGLTGSISGIILPGGAINQSLKENVFGQERAQKYADLLNKDLETLNSHIGELSALTQDLGAQTRTDKFQTAFKSLHRTVATAAKFGKLEDLKSSIEELGSLPLDEYNKAFFEKDGFKTDLEKNRAIATLLMEVDNIEQDATAIEKAHVKNPFSNSRTRDLLRKKFKVDEQSLSGVEQKLFEDWKESQSYLIGRLRNTSSDISQIKQDLKLGNVQSEEEFQTTYATLVALSSPDAVYSYLAMKNRNIETLKAQEIYFKELGDRVKEKAAKESLKSLSEYYDKIQQALDSEDYDTLQSLIIKEEFSGTSGELVAQKLQEAKFQELMKKMSEKEIVDAAENPEEEAEKVVETISKIEESEQANNPITEEVKKDVPDLNPPQYDFLRTLNKGTKVVYLGKVYTLKDTTISIIYTEEGVVFTPHGVATDQLLDYEGDITLYKPDLTPTSKSEPVSISEPTQDLTDPYEEFDNLTRGKQVVPEPKNEGGRYIIYGVDPEVGYDIWTLKNGKLIAVREGKRVGIKSLEGLKFYSLDGEPIIEEKKEDEIIIPEIPKTDFKTPKKVKDKIKNKEVQEKEETKSKTFSSIEVVEFFLKTKPDNKFAKKDTSDELKQVLLQAIEKDVININCK